MESKGEPLSGPRKVWAVYVDDRTAIRLFLDGDEANTRAWAEDGDSENDLPMEVLTIEESLLDASSKSRIDALHVVSAVVEDEDGETEVVLGVTKIAYTTRDAARERAQQPWSAEDVGLTPGDLASFSTKKITFSEGIYVPCDYDAHGAKTQLVDMVELICCGVVKPPSSVVAAVEAAAGAADGGAGHD